MLGKLAGGLAHDIRNPLSALKLNLNYLKSSKDNLDSESCECIDSCLEAVDRIQTIIENTLEFSKKPIREESLISLNDLARQAIDIVAGEARRKNIIFQSSLQANLPSISFNKNKLMQVMLNIMTNAVDASYKNEKVFVKTFSNNNGNIVFEVEDFGIGIKEEDKSKIFNDFYTNKKGGTGLGLTVCKMLLEGTGAKIEFDSLEGKNTKFAVLLPLHSFEEKNET